MRLCTPLGVGVVWDSGRVPGARGYALLPTKTSRFWNQFVASVPLRLKIGFHVFSASLLSLLLALFLCAIILSVVSRSFIAQDQHLRIPGSFTVGQKTVPMFGCFRKSGL